MQIVTPKCSEICQSGAMCRFCSANLSNLDVKYNNLSFDDPNWGDSNWRRNLRTIASNE